VVLSVVFMALMMFYWADISEKYFGKRMSWREIKKVPANTKKVLASAALVFVSLFVLFSGQPSPEDKWEWVKAKETEKLERRDVFIHPGELLEVMNDPLLYTRLLDIRSETDYNLFHLENAQQVTFENIHDGLFMKELSDVPSNTVVVVMSNGEADAVKAYKLLKGQGVLNLYILSGGINNWLTYFPLDIGIAERVEGDSPGESLHYVFDRAVGEAMGASNPGTEHDLKIEFEKKVKIQKKKIIAGGCG